MRYSKISRVSAACGWLLPALSLGGLSSCAQREAPASPPAGAATASASAAVAPPPAAALSPTFKPTATFQEIMDAEVAPSADFIWAAVSSTVTKKGVEEHQPHTPKEWHELRRRAIALVEVSNLLVIPGRTVARGNTTLEDASPLDTPAIQKRLDANPAAVAGFAEGLRSVSMKLLDAIDKHDVAGVSSLGGTLDEVCESCHLTFWYPPAPAKETAAKPKQGG